MMDLVHAQPGATSDLRCVIASPAEDVATVRLIGEIDHSNADWLADLLDSVLVAGWNVTWIDLDDVRFIDSTGLTILERHALEAQFAERPWSVVAASKAVRRLAQLLGSEWILGGCR